MLAEVTHENDWMGTDVSHRAVRRISVEAHQEDTVRKCSDTESHASNELSYV